MAQQAKVAYASGSRKTSSARVFMKPGSGKIIINGKAHDEYMKTLAARAALLQPLELTGTKGLYDLMITVTGGGLSGQAEAIRHGVSRVLLTIDEGTHRAVLKKAGLLTRDSRMVERKKYGKHKARRSVQYSKR